MSTTEAQVRVALNPTQRHVFDEVLALGGNRPTAPEGIATELEQAILSGTAASMGRWTEKRLWFGKSHLTTVLRCEGQVVASADRSPQRGMLPATAVGIVAHRAIQIAHTHPGRPEGSYVDAAIEAATGERDFGAFWESADLSTQSDLITQAVSKVIAFLDSWPTLEQSWTPRFEESIQARVGGLLLAARVDLILGRPKPGGRQTMLLCDLKSRGISDSHELEASFYALVSTIRHGIPPWRSFVYSLSSGEYTDPDITPDRLRETAAVVVDAVNKHVAVLTEERPPLLTAGPHCRWCSLNDTCPTYAAEGELLRPAL